MAAKQEPTAREGIVLQNQPTEPEPGHPSYPVYMLERVAAEIFTFCSDQEPLEALGKLLGHRCEWEGRSFVRIVDWVTGEVVASSTSARFTPDGVRECETRLDQKYGDDTDRPREVGLFHSHPFGSDPHFSSIDHATFLNFPYDRAGNVFVLIDPLSGFFKTFLLEVGEEGKRLTQVPWAVYASS